MKPPSRRRKPVPPPPENTLAAPIVPGRGFAATFSAFSRLLKFMHSSRRKNSASKVATKDKFLTTKEDNDEVKSFIHLQVVDKKASDDLSCKNLEAKAFPGEPEDESVGLLEDKVKSFKDLGVVEQLVEACDSLGWKNPSQVQAEAIPHALQGKDLIGVAQTGSGKTGAFAIPILQDLLQSSQIQKGKPPPTFFACVLSPARELAIQIAEHFEGLGSGIGVKCAVLVGGVSEVQQQIAIAKRPHIIAATPGRLKDHLSNTKGFSLRTLKYLVLDEADKLLGQEFEKDIDYILQAIPRERRTYLFSATMTEKVQKLQRACLKNPVKIETASKYSTVKTLKKRYLFIPNIRKDWYLVHLLTLMPHCTSMVFTRTCDSAHLLYLMLKNLGFRAVPISGHMTQATRLASLNKFKAGECNILVCTDVASRGLDIPSVSLVINYNIPANSKDYIHRVGRTARAGRSGLAISLVDQYELEWHLLVEKLLGNKIPEFPVQEKEVNLLEERVREAKRISQMKINETGGSKRKRGGGYDSDDDVMKYLGLKKGKNSKPRKR